MLDLVHELTALVQSFERQGIPYALCGGMALAVHNAPRATQDIDLMARQEDIERISLKLAAGRPQDIADIQRLREVHRG